jgi:hypothetical protein
MHKNTINIKNITCVVNLQNTAASQYLNFKQTIKSNLPAGIDSNYEESCFDNKYLIFYFIPNALGKSIAIALQQIMQDYKMDYVIIDELFPLDNSLILEKKEVPITAKWIKNTHFSKLESFIEVI